MARRFRSCGSRFSVAPIMFALLSLVAAHAQDVPLDRRTGQVPDLNRLDLVRASDSDGYKGAPRQGTPAAQADDLRKLVKTRATSYEAMDDWDRAEAQYNSLVEMQPIDPMAY